MGTMNGLKLCMGWVCIREGGKLFAAMGGSLGDA